MCYGLARMNQLGSIQVREGDLLAGKYRIERVIGVGGMGIVVAARHEQLDQPVAIKFVRDDVLDNDEAVERFLREARSAARLKSEHVARVLDVGRLESGAPYMVMELLEGNDLGQALTRDGPMVPETAVALMLQVCEAVAEAHAAGIVHRDLKPENLFLTRTVGGSAKMKVLDFGVSKAISLVNDPKANLTRTRAVLGSPLYMPPEQLRSSRDVDVRGDVWALGVVLFELLTNRSPFEAETMPELCLKVVSEPPLSLAELRPGLPPGLVAVVDRCLQKDRNQRYANAAELALALEAFAPWRSNMASAHALAASLRESGVPGVQSLPLSGAPFVPLSGTPSLPLSGAPSSPLSGAPSLPLAGTLSGAGPAGPSAERVASIPAAWGTEGQRDTQRPVASRRRSVMWTGLALAVVGGAAALLALRGPADAQRPDVAAAHAEPPPPAASLVDPAPATSSLAADLPPAAPGQAAEPSSRQDDPQPPSAQAVSAQPASAQPALAQGATAQPASARAASAQPALPGPAVGATARPNPRVVRPQAPPSGSRPIPGSDEDIPSLR
jgi:eukaryotic-like serine/threonine-protein kinase